MNILTVLIVFSTISFIFFGIGCFVAPKMKSEFIRYGVPEKRKLVGALQLLGALGLIVGYYYQIHLSIISASGLCLLMILGFSVRLKIKDSFFQSAPSLIYAIINLLIAINLFNF